jgi:hypothetical protein
LVDLKEATDEANDGEEDLKSQIPGSSGSGSGSIFLLIQLPGHLERVLVAVRCVAIAGFL